MIKCDVRKRKESQVTPSFLSLVIMCMVESSLRWGEQNGDQVYEEAIMNSVLAILSLPTGFEVKIQEGFWISVSRVSGRN